MSNLPLQIRMPDVVGATMRGTQAAGAINQVQRQNRMAQVYNDHGAGIVSGEADALNALAAIDPMNALNVKNTHAQMAERQERLRLARAAGARAAANARMNRQQKAEAKAEYEMLRRVAMAGQQGPEALTQAINTSGLGSQGVTAENFDMYLATAQGAAGTLFDAVQEVRGSGTQATEADREIARLESIGLSREQAIQLKEGVLRTTTDPVTRETSVMNMVTGERVGQAPVEAEAQVAQAPLPETDLQFGQPYTAAEDSFGIGGAARRAANAIADTAGADVPFPEVQQTQSDFGVLREKLIADIANGYQRQPPSWLLQNIRDLTPAAGSVLQGSEGAQTQLRSIARDLNDERTAAMRQLSNRALSPTDKAKLETRLEGIEAAMSRVGSALSGFRTEQPAGSTSNGVQWKIVE